MTRHTRVVVSHDDGCDWALAHRDGYGIHTAGLLPPTVPNTARNQSMTRHMPTPPGTAGSFTG